jgi:surface polysaccharide O-acyltransferase-like enzyme
VLQYGAYFFLGAAVGAFGLNKGLAAKDGMLAKRWPLWAIAMVVVFLIVATAELHAIKHQSGETMSSGSLVAIGWVISCATSSFALPAIFVRFARPNPVLTSFANNSYGIYLVHYPLVTWTQYALLSLHLSPILKAVIVLVTAVGVGWAIVAALRQIPAVRRVV